MIIEISTPPAEEPVSVSEIKTHLRIDVSDEDTLLAGYISAAREMCETISRRAFVTQTIQTRFMMWPASGRFMLPRPPLQSVTSISYTDSAGVSSTMSSSDYIVYSAPEPGQIILGYGKSWPTATLQPGPSILIEYVAGYGVASAVPQRYKQAIMLLAGHYFENRESVVVTQGISAIEVPRSVNSLLKIDRGWYYG